MNLCQGRIFVSPLDHASAPAFLAHWPDHPKPLPPDREPDQTFLWLKGKWGEGGGFDSFLMTVY